MYIFELIAKIIKNKKTPKESPAVSDTPDNNDEQNCSHIFLPIDSTGETLACTKCGMIIKNDSTKYKPKNPFN